MYDPNGKIVLIIGIGPQAEEWGNGTAMANLFTRQGATVYDWDLTVNLEAANRAAKTTQDDERVRKNRSSSEHVAEGDLHALRKVQEKQTPMSKMGTAWDVAHAALYLCSSEAAYVTGAELVLDGGFSVSTGAERYVPAKARM